MDAHEIAALLGKLPGLETTHPGERLAIAAQFTPKVFRNEFLCTEGEEPSALWVLIQGTLDVMKRSESGRQYVVAQLNPVCLFGHVGLITYSGRTASVRANGEVRVLEMSNLRVRLLLRNRDFALVSPFRRALIIALGRQLTVANETVMRLALESGAGEGEGTEDDGDVPPDAERRLLGALSAV